LQSLHPDFSTVLLSYTISPNLGLHQKLFFELKRLSLCCVMVTKSLTVNELLRQHAGRFVETSTMYLLYDGCIQASSKSDKVLRLIAGMCS
jgi:hypothetical protein